ncbi:hypothetical protein GDO81_016788 [Engystomops pustulosus]|uniref:Interleukin-4 receptor subunit alpha n=1 Tax=Engystomops pustulosus TaxID=76066 RepID=A0AAV7ACT9_ENGPU|nr:hypothetical protein GDO81_016788 [Engystomops pustulosus]KAG8557944.1 hypothetical protein GDO81_016788 [Engystomops pustulosus]KAG8557945.1 hypothetical protein GDO81_016788 [Engystomops pustulosus]
MKNKKYEPIATLILVTLSCVVPISQCCQDLLCYIDFLDTLTCEYGKGKDLNTSTTYTLTANWTFEESDDTCVLVECEKKHEYICSVDMEDFNADDTCTITITTHINGRRHSIQICEPFRIGDRFKPVAPVNLTISENYTISWETLYDDHVLRSGELAYELSYKKVGEAWLKQKVIQVLEDEKSVVLLRSSFQGGQQYIARIRAQPKNTSIYGGQWSEWSRSVSWITPEDDQKVPEKFPYQKIGMISGLIAVVAFLGIVTTCFRYTPLIWKKVWVLIPDPEPFFKPLYKGHEGDFKSWLGPHYIPFPIVPHEGGYAGPEVLEIENHNSGKNKKLFLPKLYMNEDPGTNCSSHSSTSTTTTTGGRTCEEDRSMGEGYPSINLDSSNMLDRLLVHGSSTVSPKFGFHEALLISNMNMLNQVSIPPEEWEQQESPSQEDDENLFYNNENYNSLSPDSGNSAHFGYPRICLDMDTIDSGFVDSECGSPVDSDFGNNDTPKKTMNPDPYNEEDAISERNYVQQWVPNAH